MWLNIIFHILLAHMIVLYQPSEFNYKILVGFSECYIIYDVSVSLLLLTLSMSNYEKVPQFWYKAKFKIASYKISSSNTINHLKIIKSMIRDFSTLKDKEYKTLSKFFD